MLIDTIKSYFEKKQPSEKPVTTLLDASMTTQLKGYFEKLRTPVELRASLDASGKAQEMRAFLGELAALSDKLVLRDDGNDERKPSFSVARPDETTRIRFAGIPLGHELTSLVLALLHTGGHPPKVEDSVLDSIRALSGPLHFETFITLSCHNCPDVVQTFNLMAAANPAITHTMIDGNLFKNEIDQHRIDAVPTIFLNGKPFDRGRKTLEEFIAKVQAHCAENRDSLH